MEQIKLNGRYFDNNRDAVHVSDKDTQKMIDEVIKDLIESKENSTWRMQATGDTVVFGFSFKEEREIEIFVTQNYSHACLLKNKYDNYEPIDWGTDYSLEDATKEELIAEIQSLRRQINNYDPKREI